MGLLTDFELLLLGVCIAAYGYGLRAFIKDIYLKKMK